MHQTDKYVRTDEHGVMRVGDTRVMLDSVLAGFDQGHSPESIHQQYPSLSLEQVYGAITYILAHSNEIAAYREKQKAVWDAMRAKADASPSPVVERLKRWKTEGSKETSRG